MNGAPAAPQAPGRLAPAVGRALVAVFVARTAVNGGLRVVYPFLPEIARGIGTSLGVAGALVSLRSLAGLTAPLVPRAAERWGRRALMLAALFTLVAGCLLIAGAGTLAAAVVGFTCIGLAKPLFDVPMQSWFGERVPYHRRGRVLGATELTWALSLLVTVPVSGVLIASSGWAAPFVLVTVLALCGLVAVAWLIAPDRPAVPQRGRLVLTRPRVAVLAAALAFTTGSELLFVVYGAWLEDDFGLSVTAIGAFSLIVVAAELAGEGAVTAFADRLGLRRAILTGLGASIFAYSCLGLVGPSLPAAVGVVIVWFAGFEMTIVSTIPFVTGLTAPTLNPPGHAPSSQTPDRMLALLVGIIAAGRAAGALIAPQLYELGGVATNGRAAAGCGLLALLLLLTVPEPGAGDDGPREP